MEAGEKRLVDSEVIFGFSEPLAEPRSTLGRSAVRVSGEKEHTHCALSYTLERGETKVARGQEVKWVIVSRSDRERQEGNTTIKRKELLERN